MRSDGYMVSMDIRRGSLNLDQEYIRVKRGWVKRNPIVCQEFFCFKFSYFRILCMRKTSKASLR
jgi:hypothetical protein